MRSARETPREPPAGELIASPESKPGLNEVALLDTSRGLLGVGGTVWVPDPSLRRARGEVGRGERSTSRLQRLAEDMDVARAERNTHRQSAVTPWLTPRTHCFAFSALFNDGQTSRFLPLLSSFGRFRFADVLMFSLVSAHFAFTCVRIAGTNGFCLAKIAAS